VDPFKAFEFATAGNAAAMAGENCTWCRDAGCTNGTCMDGMFLQQSCWLWLCEQGIEAQQCIAAWGDWSAEQSTA
jgi:hypothetical protein